jgi:hypothetical protein
LVIVKLLVFVCKLKWAGCPGPLDSFTDRSRDDDTVSATPAVYVPAGRDWTDGLPSSAVVAYHSSNFGLPITVPETTVLARFSKKGGAFY